MHRFAYQTTTKPQTCWQRSWQSLHFGMLGWVELDSTHVCWWKCNVCWETSVFDRFCGYHRNAVVGTTQRLQFHQNVLMLETGEWSFNMMKRCPRGNLSIYLSIHPSIYLILPYLILPYLALSYLVLSYLVLSVYLYIYRSIYRSIYLYIYISIYLPIYLSIYRSIHLSIYLSVYLSILFSIYIYVIIYTTYLGQLFAAFFCWENHNGYCLNLRLFAGEIHMFDSPRFPVWSERLVDGPYGDLGWKSR